MAVDLGLLEALRSVPGWLDGAAFDLNVCSDALRRAAPHVVRLEDVERLQELETELRAIRHRVAAALQHLR